MKLCPKCQNRYDEKTLRFCKKDGTPLIDDNQPQFTQLPSESLEDDEGEVTVIRRKTPRSNPESGDIPPSQPDLGATNVNPREKIADQNSSEKAERIVIPTSEDKTESYQQVRSRTMLPEQRPPLEKRSNTLLVVLMTFIGTVVIIGGIGGVFWILSNQGNEEANSDMNANFNSFDENLNTNLEIDNTLANFDYDPNSNGNSNLNGNENANTETPTPTKSPSPSPSPTTEANANANVANTATPTPTPTTPKPTPTPTKPPSPTPAKTPAPTPAKTPANAGNSNRRIN